MITESNWLNELTAAIMVCDASGNIIYMNDRSSMVFENDGGRDLIGNNLFDCHTGLSAEKLPELLQNKKANVYTIEKNDAKKMIYQSPWYTDGKFMGLVEISFEIPTEMPHFIRKA